MEHRVDERQMHIFLQSPAGGGSIFLVSEREGEGVVFLISFTEMESKGEVGAE
jgi:hypothetical protein